MFHRGQCERSGFCETTSACLTLTAELSHGGLRECVCLQELNSLLRSWPERYANSLRLIFRIQQMLHTLYSCLHSCLLAHLAPKVKAYPIRTAALLANVCAFTSSNTTDGACTPWMQKCEIEL